MEFALLMDKMWKSYFETFRGNFIPQFGLQGTEGSKLLCCVFSGLEERLCLMLMVRAINQSVTRHQHDVEQCIKMSRSKAFLV